ncbi:hypothetical protein CHISP_0564 [Chitinispirillum alkaliphilum]|nr:hypothetical protein CHISP_0564 [Chitinispirillum alkaliphilum]
MKLIILGIQIVCFIFFAVFIYKNKKFKPVMKYVLFSIWTICMVIAGLWQYYQRFEIVGDYFYLVSNNEKSFYICQKGLKYYTDNPVIFPLFVDKRSLEECMYRACKE